MLPTFILNSGRTVASLRGGRSVVCSGEVLVLAGDIGYIGDEYSETSVLGLGFRKLQRGHSDPRQPRVL